MEKLINRKYIKRLYILLTASVFIHYILVTVFTVLILREIIFSGEYKKILKDRLLIIVEIILGIATLTSLFYRNYFGLVAVPVLLLCLVVGRYYTLRIDNKFKKYILELIAKMSIIPFFISVAEYCITKDRVGYFAYLNPNYLGSIMMISAIVNLYFALSKEKFLYFILFLFNISTILLSGSRSALVSTGIGTMTLLFHFLEKKYFAGCLLLLVGYILGVYFGRLPFLRMETVAEYYKLRTDIIKRAFKIFKDTNILYGHGNFFYYKSTNYVYPHSHNALIESLLSYGLVGTLAIAVVFLRYLYEIIKSDRKHTLKTALLLGTAAHNFTDFTIFWIQTVLLFIMVLSYVENEKKKRNLKKK